MRKRRGAINCYLVNYCHNKKSDLSRRTRCQNTGRLLKKGLKAPCTGKKKGTLSSGKGGKGGKVKSKKQAIAIGLSEARKKGAKVPKKKSTKKSSKKKSSKTASKKSSKS